MNGPAYYNENDPVAAAWLRELIAAGEIAPGDVDERSIKKVKAADLKGYAQCHFFAGIGGWSLALRLAGWPDDRQVWTGSCPCQPFSGAGKRGAFRDRRHLWPAWFPLIEECAPATVFGEQVADAVRWGWLDLVFDDLEGRDYACGAQILPACSVGAFHIRQRAWFVADAQRGAAERYRHNVAAATGCAQEKTWQRKRLRDDARDGDVTRGGLADADQGQRRGIADRKRGLGDRTSAGRSKGDCEPQSCGVAGDLADAAIAGRSTQPQRTSEADRRPAAQSRRLRDTGGMADADGQRAGLARKDVQARQSQSGRAGVMGDAASPRLEIGSLDQERSRVAGHQGPSAAASGAQGRAAWQEVEWLPCVDDKSRPIEPGTFPLAHGIPGRVGRLRGYGNAIVPQLAAAFIIEAEAAIRETRGA